MNFGELQGKTFKKVERGESVDEGEYLKFYTEDKVYTLYHKQDCCESVNIEDICGELDDLVGSEILLAEEVKNGSVEIDDGSETWTFYKIGTIKGGVTIRWYGQSNGWYSESVDFKVEDRTLKGSV